MDPLAIDLYAGDGDFDLAKVIAAGAPWHLVMLKATQGNYYRASGWFGRMWKIARDTERYGVDWFRTAYHYLDVRVDAKLQADYFLAEVERAGGWGHGDIYPCVDVERGGQRVEVSAQQVIDVTSTWVDAVRTVTGQRVVLYGGSYLRDLKIVDHMGCSFIWVADYERHLDPHHYADISFSLAELFAWQGVGVNGDGTVSGKWDEPYPLTTPAGRADLSAVTIDGGGAYALEHLRRAGVVAA